MEAAERLHCVGLIQDKCDVALGAPLSKSPDVHPFLPQRRGESSQEPQLAMHAVADGSHDRCPGVDSHVEDTLRDLSLESQADSSRSDRCVSHRYGKADRVL